MTFYSAWTRSVSRSAYTAAAWIRPRRSRAIVFSRIVAEHLLPAVPYRQWVLSFRSSLSVRLGYGAHALSLVSRSLARHLGRRLRRNVATQHGLAHRGDLHPGIVLYVHLHLLVADGVWRQTSDGRVEFLPLVEPTRRSRASGHRPPGRAVTMTPQQWLAKLAALVPPPKVHQVRYGGVFMPTVIACVAPSPPRRRRR